MASKLSERPESLQPSDFKTYLNCEVLLLLYKEIAEANSPLLRVHTFYLNFLPEIFRIKDGFSSTGEYCPAADLGFTQQSNLRAINFFNFFEDDLFPTKVVLCNHKKKGGEFDSAVWAESLQQLVTYASIVRGEDLQDPNGALYLTSHVGTHLRFYELPENSVEVRDWAPAGGRTYELADDEEKVWELWHRLRSVVVER